MKRRNLETVSSFRKNLQRRKLGVSLSNASTASTVGTDVGSNGSGTPQKQRASRTSSTGSDKLSFVGSSATTKTTTTTSTSATPAINRRSSGQIVSQNTDPKLIGIIKNGSSCPPSPISKMKNNDLQSSKLSITSRNTSVSAHAIKEVSFAEEDSHKIVTPLENRDTNSRYVYHKLRLFS
jgi:hypothetical protein